ncbi:MAG TPA: PDZ domain-containing protein [Acetobacteraceae bacterium]|nr:PDZ domain-containing protein [Acetobacteraceae bacterium]
MQTNGWLIADDAPPAPAPMFDEGAVDGRVGVSAQPLAASLVNTPGAPRRALGIRLITVPAEMSGWLHMDSANGLLVLGVIPGGAAAAAGVRPDDVLLTLADAPVTTAEDVNAALAAVHGQDVVAAQIWRNGQMQSVRLTF